MATASGPPQRLRGGIGASPALLLGVVRGAQSGDVCSTGALSLLFGSSPSTLLHWRSLHCGRCPNYPLFRQRKQGPERVAALAKRSHHKFRAQPGQILQTLFAILLLWLADLTDKIQEVQFSLNFR